VHSENLVAAAEGPVLVDAETALTPGRRPPPGRVTGSGFEALAGSPLSVLVLPVTVDGPQGRYDPSVLGDTDDQPAGLAQVWQDPGGPGMHSVLGQVVRRHTNTALPSDSSGTWSWDASSVLEGFTSLLHALCGRADELLAPDAMPRSLVRSCCAGGEGVVVDGGWSGVSGAGGFVASFDPVAVVAGPFDRAWAGAFTAGGDQQRGDPGEVAAVLFGPVLRGEWPPSRWRFGG